MANNMTTLQVQVWHQWLHTHLDPAGPANLEDKDVTLAPLMTLHSGVISTWLQGGTPGGGNIIFRSTCNSHRSSCNTMRTHQTVQK